MADPTGPRSPSPAPPAAAAGPPEGDERRRRSSTFWIRKAHRWLGLIIGIQFFLWTASGIYFAWVPLPSVHGDHLLAEPRHLDPGVELASPATALAQVRAIEPVRALISVEVIRLLDRPLYRLTYLAEGVDGSAPQVRLAEGATGELRGPITREEAIAVGRELFAFADEAPVREVRLLVEVNAHHEIRGFPLPAWAIDFDHPSGATAYVGAETALVQRIRNHRWRGFDFLWMLHTMDYGGRDDFNNLLIRLFSLFALATVLAGFLLFVATSRPYRRWLGRRARTG